MFSFFPEQVSFFGDIEDTPASHIEKAVSTCWSWEYGTLALEDNALGHHALRIKYHWFNGVLECRICRKSSVFKTF